MGDAYGWTDNGRQVFDPVLLEKAAAELRQKNTPQQLTDQLLDLLANPAAFGDLPRAAEASDRLAQVYQGMKAELQKVGVDMADLASRTLAAAQMAHDVDPATQAAARHGMRIE